MENNSKNTYLLPLLLAGCIALGLWFGNVLTPKGVDFSASSGGMKYQKLQDIIEVLNQKYVDSLNGDQLFEQTITDMLHKLDPHSNYIAAQDMQEMNESIEGKFGGIGVRFFILRDTVCVTNVIAGSPSFAVGIQAGDKIIAVNGKSIARKKITNEKIMSLLKGRENTSVTLQIARNGQKLTKTITRGSIPIESVVAAHLIQAGIGYVKIDQFSVTTAIEFKKAVTWLKEQGMKKLVLDLRHNGGGVLQSATDIADEFLGENVPILVTKGEHIGKKTYRATSGGLLEKMPVAVLINAGSASASEIVAGALQDNDRAIIVGRRSFGKGLVQEDVQLRDGSNLRLTVARYYTPTGRCIQKNYSEGYDQYMNAQIERYENGELYVQDSSVFVDSLKFKTPKGRIVYGGGGIMPDIFVPFDSTGMSWYFSELRFNQVFSAYAFDYVQNKRTKWRNAAAFDREFRVTDAVLEQFTRFAEKELKIPIDKMGLKQSKRLIEITLKAEIARQIWLENGYFQISNKTDKEVQQAIRSLTK
jgi:carboxyl-terminal processing protease